MVDNVHAPVLGFDDPYVLRDLGPEMLQRYVSLEAYVNSKIVFDVLANQVKTCKTLTPD